MSVSTTDKEKPADNISTVVDGTIMKPTNPDPQIPTFAINGIFLIMLAASLVFAKDFFLPVVVAFILALTMSPIVRFFKRLGVPPPLTAVLLVVAIFIAMVLLGYLMASPIADWINRAPEIGRDLKFKFSEIIASFENVIEAQKQVEEATSAASSGVVDVAIKGPGLFATAADNLVALMTSLAITMVMLVFLLASGDMFYAKLVQNFDHLSEKKIALTIAHDVERVISRYLFTITIVNIALGFVVGTGLYFLGMPTPIVWGIMAALLNFMPYIGALMGLIIATVIAIVTFDSLGDAAVITLFYFSCTFIEGQFITPTVVGKRLEINAIAIFVAVAFWGFLWGIVGALLAVPILVISKTILDHFEAGASVSNFISARSTKSVSN